MTRAVAISILAAVLVAACGVLQPSVDRSLSVPGPGGQGGPLYPGRVFSCVQIERCDDLAAEIDRWAARTRPELGTPVEISYHGAVDDGGRTTLLTRTGGASYIAVVTFGDGSRAAAMVGCGIGVDPKPCFWSP